MNNVIAKKLLELGYENVQVNLSNDLEYGDLTTNVAMQYAKEKSMNPRDLASQITKELGKIQGIAKIEIAGPGFINFYLDDNVLTDTLQSLLANPSVFLKNNHLEGHNVMLEYTTQNVLKQFHVGHLMSNVIGNAIANLYEFSGATVKRDSYHGDVGLHIAKTIYGALNSKVEQPADSEPVELRIKYLGQMYAFGNTAYETDDQAVESIKDINRQIYEQEPGEVWSIYQLATKWSLESFQSIYNRLNIQLDYTILESQTAELGLAESKVAAKNMILQNSDGAVAYLPAENEKLIPVVFVNSSGFPLYAAKDLGLIQLKQQLWPEMTRTLVFTANEQSASFKVVKKVIQALYPKLDQDFLTHVGHGYLSLTSGKMSSRTGEVLPANEALDIIKASVLEKMADREIIDLQKEQIAEKVAQAAVRFTILKGSIYRDVVFDFDEALNFEGDTGPYLQYSVVRLHSIIQKAHLQGIKKNVAELSPEEAMLVRQLYQSHEIIIQATTNLEPQTIVSYLLKLAHSVNSYYANNQVINSDNAQTSSHRLGIIIAVANTMEVLLNLLGIQVPLEM